MESKSWLKNIKVGMVKNGCSQSGHRTLKLAVSQEGINGINNFFACWHKFKKVKSSCSNCWVGMIKNGCGLLSHGTLKFAVSQEWIDELNWFFAYWYNSRKTND